MTDKISRERRSANMSAIRGKGTKPELLVRRLLHRLGYRYRLHRKDLPGRPDIVFLKRRKAIEVRGCFWHQHPDPSCRKARQPASNEAFWNEKLRRNVERDAANLKRLGDAGWEVLVLWECELSATDLAPRLTNFLGPRARQSTNGSSTPGCSVAT
jgi:DNA mismatch endonuclease (patch repair protein)